MSRRDLLAFRIDEPGQVVPGLVAITEDATYPVLERDQIPARVVGVTQHRSRRIGDVGQPPLSVAAERNGFARAVGDPVLVDYVLPASTLSI